MALPPLRRRTKRTERPADAILGPLAELPLAPNIADEISMLWGAIGRVGRRRFHGEHRDENNGAREKMLAETRAVVDRVRARAARPDFTARLTDNADGIADQHASDLAALVRRDARHLGSDLVVATMLLWKLQVVHGMQHARHGAPRFVVAERARKYLGKVGDAARTAVAHVTGRGRQEYAGLVLPAQHEHNIERVGEVLAAIDAGKSDDVIAGEVLATIEAKAAVSIVADIRKRPRTVTAHATRITFLGWGVGSERQLARLLHDARAEISKLDPGPDDREVDALAREHPTRTRARKLKRRAK